MIHAADYRKRAEDCARRASDAQDEYHRKNFQQLADLWTDMADRAEGREPLLTRLSKNNKMSADERKAITDALATIRKV